MAVLDDIDRQLAVVRRRPDARVRAAHDGRREGAARHGGARSRRTSRTRSGSGASSICSIARACRRNSKSASSPTRRGRLSGGCSELIDWLIDQDFRQWQAVTATARRAGRKHDRGRLLGSPEIGHLPSDRTRLIDAVGREAQRRGRYLRQAPRSGGDRRTGARRSDDRRRSRRRRGRARHARHACRDDRRCRRHRHSAGRASLRRSDSWSSRRDAARQKSKCGRRLRRCVIAWPTHSAGIRARAGAGPRADRTGRRAIQPFRAGRARAVDRARTSLTSLRSRAATFRGRLAA